MNSEIVLECLKYPKEHTENDALVKLGRGTMSRVDFDITLCMSLLGTLEG